MFKLSRVRITLFGPGIALLFLLVVVMTAAYAANLPPVQENDLEIDLPYDLEDTSLLTVTILSSPWALVDSNKPGGPEVFVVEAAISNTSDITLTDLVVELKYGPDAGWLLLAGEDPLRILPSLGPQETYYAYWFARYPAVVGASHQYTITADANGTDPISTSDNYYGNPETGKTIKTFSYQDTGNSSIFEPEIEAFVGGIFTATVIYDLGNNPLGVGFSPVGNPDFKPSSARLLATHVRFFTDTASADITIPDRLYFDELPLINGNTVPDMAEVSYVFLPLKLDTIEMCPYAAVQYSHPPRIYDKDYCDSDEGTIIIIDFTLSFSMSKEASSEEVLQNKTLTYTLHYSNEGTLPLVYAWLWDVVDPDVVSILTYTVSPPTNPDWSTDSLLAWYVGDVPFADEPGSGGSMTFTVLVDGNGQDLADGTPLVNNAFFGFNQGGLPSEAALTSTITTTVQAPIIILTKSDGLENINPGDQLTYTLNAVNNGSVDAWNVVISDVLPIGVSYVPETAGETGLIGQTLYWTLTEPLSAIDGSVNIDVPVTVDWDLPDGTVLTNVVSIDYKNELSYVYETMIATDTTTVDSPALAIAKADFPDPVLSGNPLTYTLTCKNSGNGPATGVVITDSVPLSTTFDSCPGDTCSIDGDTVTWELSAISADSSESVAFTVIVSSTLVDGTLLSNDDYGLTSNETGFIAGETETTLVFKNAGNVDGTAFVDQDGNGEMDPGEAGIANVTVSLPDATEPNTTTNGSGYYLFRVEEEKLVPVSAGLPAGYFRTSAGTVWVVTHFGVTDTVDFGYAPVTATFGSIYGTVFEDLDEDGVQESGEAGLADVLITLSGTITTTTDSYGRYVFTTTVAGTHRVVETDLPGYISTTPNEVVANVTIGSDKEVNFGDILERTASFSSIVGTVFDDSDGDGVWDLNEPGLEGVTVTLDGLVTTTTDINGSYSFTATVPITHTVIETDPDGFRSTTPNRVHVVADIGNIYTVNFGDTTFSGTANIFGTVFEDFDGDGQWDAGEIGIAGVLITLDGVLTDTTDVYGNYGFVVGQARVYPLVESDPPDHFSTTPNEVHLSVDLGQSYLVDYGDARDSSDFAAIFGTVFEDLNSDGLWDDDEVGLTDVTVNLESDNRQTGSYGGYSFMTTVAGSHTVVEEDPPGYFSTTPNTVTLSTVTLGQGYRVDFGDVPAEVATCPDDSFEKDDDLDQANELDPSGVQDHDFCKDPIDWVWFDATDGFEYTISTSSWGQRADTVLTLFDQDERRLAANDDEANSGDFSSDLVWRATYSGRHYVRVTNRANLTGFHTDYELSLSVQEEYGLYLPIIVKSTVNNHSAALSKPAISSQLSANQTIEPAGVIAHSCPDGNEIDDTWQLAKPVAPGVEQIHSFDSNPYLNAADKDFLWFNVNRLDVYTFTLTSVTNTSAVLELYDSQGNLLDAKDDQQLVWSWQDGGLGRYYLSVSPAPGAMNYGCPQPPEQSGDPDQVGYKLLAEVDLGSTLYLPVIYKSGD